MYLSSRFAAGLLAMLASTGAANAELASRPAFAGIRPTIVSRVPHFPTSGIAPTIVGPRDGYPSAGIRPTFVSPYRHGYGHGYAYGGYGLGYDGTANADFDGPAIYPSAPGPIDAPPPFAFRPRRAPCPQIIEINGGLARKATTRVVSGTPCRR